MISHRAALLLLAHGMAEAAADRAIAEAVADDQPRGGRTPHLDTRLAERIERERKRSAFGSVNCKRGLNHFRG